MKSYKLYIDSAAWVCEGNLVGTSKIYRYILENGHKITDDPSKADFIIINSCGVSKNREDISVDLFKKYQSQKKENASIVMYGCMIKINEERINSLDIYPISFEEVSKFDKIFYRKIKFEDVSPYCDITTKETLYRGKNIFQSSTITYFFVPILIFPFSRKIRKNYHKLVDNYTYKNKIFVEIGRGCTGNCSYCIIKKAVGNVRSRPIKDIISDIEKLYDPAKELFLVADDCGSYGVDINTNLFNLLYEINKRFPDLSIDLNYLNPFWLDRYYDEYVKLFKDMKINIASIPVQSGSSKILKNMNRKYDINKIMKLVKKIKQISPKTLTFSHFIIGFPGENTADFLKTLYCASYFDYPVAFGYSDNQQAASSSLKHHKSKFTVSIRLVLFLLFLNFLMIRKLIGFPND